MPGLNSSSVSAPDKPADTNAAPIRPWSWIPTLYLAEGLPNAIVTTVAIVLYKELGISNTNIALYTGMFYLPWVLKPLWSPVVDLLRTRRLWIWQMQLLLAAAFGGIALTLPTPGFVPLSLLLFFLIAFSSATHDIAADGFYILSLSEGQQSFFSGVRNTVYRLAALLGKGQFILLVAALEKRTENLRIAWVIAFALIAALFAGLALYHQAILPRPAADRSGKSESLSRFFEGFVAAFATYFQKPKIVVLLLFLLFYRFAEAQLLPMAQTFLVDPRAEGGLGLSSAQFGRIYGNVGVIALMIGGLLGGFLVSRRGLRACLWPMVLLMHLPDAVFVYLAYAQPSNLNVIAACVAAEQFGYGFGFTAYTLYMIYIARGEHSTAHYAICTGFMALGLMLPGLWSGWLQTKLGYTHFFMWVMLATIPGFIVTALIPLDREFGRKR